jgi:hypothetical protein
MNFRISKFEQLKKSKKSFFEGHQGSKIAFFKGYFGGFFIVYFIDISQQQLPRSHLSGAKTESIYLNSVLVQLQPVQLVQFLKFFYFQKTLF